MGDTLRFIVGFLICFAMINEFLDKRWKHGIYMLVTLILFWAYAIVVEIINA